MKEQREASEQRKQSEGISCLCVSVCVCSMCVQRGLALL